MSNIAIVDERDPLVKYVGTWNNAGAYQEFQGTTRWSATTGSTMSFTFEGTSIIVFGSVAAKDPPLSSLSFVIDGSIIGAYVPISNPPYHQPLWTSPTLSDGFHTILITQAEAQSSGVIFLDYFLYNTSSTTVESYFVDDIDPRIKYSGAWKRFGGDFDLQHTAIRTDAAGASLSFEFIGKSISYYGGADRGGMPMNASVVIDGGKPVFVVPDSATVMTTNNLFFHSNGLSDGAHTIEITSQDDNHVWIDYFLVGPGAQSSTSNNPSWGGVIGGVLLVALLIMCVVLLLRRQRRRAHYAAPDMLTVSFQPSPYQYPSNDSYASYPAPSSLPPPRRIPAKLARQEELASARRYSNSQAQSSEMKNSKGVLSDPSVPPPVYSV
ncbi:hypothetical protein C8J57DRAFT_1275089 [Mycena rebaudengoi]|nr:hypothetical protein C8J57DRAFT_1275089 [Mycena rebaudengoi]